MGWVTVGHKCDSITTVGLCHQTCTTLPESRQLSSECCYLKLFNYPLELYWGGSWPTAFKGGVCKLMWAELIPFILEEAGIHGCSRSCFQALWSSDQICIDRHSRAREFWANRPQQLTVMCSRTTTPIDKAGRFQVMEETMYHTVYFLQKHLLSTDEASLIKSSAKKPTVIQEHACLIMAYKCFC